MGSTGRVGSLPGVTGQREADFYNRRARPGEPGTHTRTHTDVHRRTRANQHSRARSLGVDRCSPLPVPWGPSLPSLWWVLGEVSPLMIAARPCLPHPLPRGTHLLLGKLIHYSLKAPFLAGSKLPALHFAATT